MSRRILTRSEGAGIGHPTARADCTSLTCASAVSERGVAGTRADQARHATLQVLAEDHSRALRLHDLVGSRDASRAPGSEYAPGRLMRDRLPGSKRRGKPSAFL